MGLVARANPNTYALRAVRSPASLAAIVTATSFGFWLAGIWGAMLFFFVGVVGAASSASCQLVRSHLDRQTLRRVRDEREAARNDLLCSTSQTRRDQYAALRLLVENVEAWDAAEADRLELQDLLEMFARLAVGHQRSVDAQHLAEGLPCSEGGAGQSRRRNELVARRIRSRDNCQRTSDRFVDDLDAIDELVRLVAQRVACPELDPDIGGEIERRLGELDDIDAELHLLSA